MLADEARRIREIAEKDTAFAGVAGTDLDTAEAGLAAASDLDAFRLEAMRLMALGGNGHSRAIANRAVKVAPLRFVWLADGLCLTEGPQAGARLVAVNGVPTEEIFTRLRPWLAGTTQRARVLAGFMLAWAPATTLATTLATGRSGPPSYCLETADGRREELRPDDLLPALELYPVSDPGAADLLIARQGIATREEARHGTFHRALAEGVPYIRIGDLAAAPPETIAARLAGIAAEVRGTRRMVVDLRGNPGGDFFGAAAFAHRLPEVAPGAALAVLVDKFTFSAALVTAALLKVHAGGRLVGEEMGDTERFHAEGGTETLPQSGLAIRHSDGWHDWAEGRADPVLTPPIIAGEMVAAGSLLPDVTAAPTGRDLASGHDPALAAALALIRA